MNLDATSAAEILLLMLAANGAPVLGKRLLGARFAAPIDGGLRLPDGRPLFGASKTWRGIVLSLVATAAGAAVLTYGWQVGALFAAGSMAGDLLSSFVKRRLGTPSSGRFLGLDQVPEALLPLWLCRGDLGLDWPSVFALVAMFFAGELVLSRLLFRIGVRDRPY